MPLAVEIKGGVLVGAITVNVVAAVAAFALVTIMLRMAILSVRYRLSGVAAPTEHAFLSTNFGCYAACLLVASVLNTVGGLISIKWTAMRAISDDNVCKLQVVMMQLGNWSLAYFTVAIAVHTFNSLVLRIRQAGIIRDVTVVVGWTIAIIAAVVPVALKPDDYGPVMVTCDFTTAHLKGKFLLHILPIIISSFLSSGMYSITFLVLRGTLSVRGGFKLTIDPTERWSSIGTNPNSYHRFVARIAGAMLWFPIAYIALLVPYSIVQLLVISGFNVSFAVIVFSFVLWFLLGVANVLLTYNIFRVLGPAIDPQSQSTEASLLPTCRESLLFGGPPPSQAPNEKGPECSLPNDYNEIIRPCAMERPIIPHGRLVPPHSKEPKSAETQPTVTHPPPDNINQQSLPPPSRPPRPKTLKLSESPPTITALAAANTDNDQSNSTGPSLDSVGKSVRPSHGLRPALSAVKLKASRSHQASRTILNEDNEAPRGNYI